ncbi:hypothetical protein HRbin27_01977 [bacterium HR27]|nr:hypothetical protein HRbin27_01977 [bacterium HR27]
MRTSETDRVQRLAERSDLVELDQHRVRRPEQDAMTHAFRVRDEEIVTDQLDPLTQSLRQTLPVIPVILRQRILNGNDRITVDPICPKVDQLIGRQRFPFTGQSIRSVLVEFAHRRIERENDLLPRAITGALDRGQHRFDRLTVAVEPRSVTAFVADRGSRTTLSEHLAQGMVDLHAPAERFAEARCAHRYDHELLHVHARTGSMLTAVQDVQHRRRQHVCIRTAEIPVEWETDGSRRGTRNRERDTQQRIRTQSTFVRCPVELDEDSIHRTLLESVHSTNRLGDRAIDVLDRPPNTFSTVAGITVPQLDRLVPSRRSTRRHRCPSNGTASQAHLDLDGGISAGVEDLTTVHHDDRRLTHPTTLSHSEHRCVRWPKCTE